MQNLPREQKNMTKMKRDQGILGLFQGTFPCKGSQVLCILTFRMLIFVLHLHNSKKLGKRINFPSQNNIEGEISFFL